MSMLEGLVVLEFCQYLSGPYSTLRLADLGARVIKIERKGSGDGCRALTIADTKIDEDSLLFNTINRNKESFEVNLKDAGDLKKIEALIAKADIIVENFRPGIMKKLGLDYDSAKNINPGIVYGSISGFGPDGDLAHLPGQDLLVQSMTGACFLNGNEGEPPMPFGLAVADIFTGSHMTQGLLAALIQKSRTGQGAHVEVSLLESMVDLQFEVITTYLNDGGNLPKRSAVNNAHAYLGAPYGIYQTTDSYIALAMGSIADLARMLNCKALDAYTDSSTWFTQRDVIKTILVDHLKTQSTDYWLDVLRKEDYWCGPVYNWDELTKQSGFITLDMIQTVTNKNGSTYQTTRCPIRVNGEVLKSNIDAPTLGQNNNQINNWISK